MNIIKQMRIIANVDQSLIIKLLNVSKYDYIGYENGSRYIPNEIYNLLLKIYGVDEYVLINGIDEETEIKLKIISNMENNEQIRFLTENLLGGSVKLTYRNVYKVKKQFK